MSTSEQSTDKPVDKADNTEAATTVTSKSDKIKTTTKKPSKSGSIILSIFIIVIIAASAGGYYYWMQFQQYLEKITYDTSVVNKKYSKSVANLDEARKNIYEQQQQIKQIQEQLVLQESLLKEFDESQKLLETTAKKVFDITHRNQTKWILSEVSYLLSIANQRLIISRDIKSSIAALKAANNRLHDLSDPSLLKLRKKISSEISQLNLLKLPDINGIAFGLDNMTLAIELLPFKSAQQKHIENTQRSKTVDIASLEKESLFSPLWNRVKSLVTVKKHQRDIQSTETPIQKNEIDSQLRYRLETSRIALINKNTAVFQHEINTALKLSSDYYNQKDNRVTSLQTELTTYSKVNLVPALPDITGSWLALQRLIAVNDSRNTLNTKKGESIQ